VQRHLGLPPRLSSTSMLGWDGIAEVVEALALEPGETLLDLACGRGGVRPRNCRTHRGLACRNRLLRGGSEAGGCISPAPWYGCHLQGGGPHGDRAGSPQGARCGLRRRYAVRCSPDSRIRRTATSHRTGRTGWLTCWEPIDRADPRVPDLLRQIDLGAGLAAAGFDNIVVSERMDGNCDVAGSGAAESGMGCRPRSAS
jgi:hypothetical protein